MLLVASTGSTAQPVLSFQPSNLDFGEIELGMTSPPQTTLLQNTGDVDASSLAFTAPGGGFVADTSACGSILPASGSCEITVHFAPAEPRQESAMLIALALGGSASLSLQGSGTGHFATVLASRASGADGVKGDASSSGPSISADGRYAVFQSTAGNLHPDDPGGGFFQDNDVYVRDLQMLETILVSRASGADGVKGNGFSIAPSISSDGRHVTFGSRATNLHPDDIDDTFDVYARDLQTHETILVSRASGADGAKGNGDSIFTSISGDGRFIAFQSGATNLHPDDTDAISDVYVRDLQTHETILISRASGVDGIKSNGSSGAMSISSDGRYVVYQSEATNLHPDDPDGGFQGTDVYVRDLQTQQTILVSRASGVSGIKGNGLSFAPSISADGRHIAYVSEANNLHPDDTDIGIDLQNRDVFVRNLDTHETIFVSRATGIDGAGSNGWTEGTTISGAGRYVAFQSAATNLHPDDMDNTPDVFFRDILEARTILVSRASGASGDKGNGSSSTPRISGTGRYVTFQSFATNLHPDDTPDGNGDVFVRDVQGPPEEGELTLVPDSLDFGNVDIGATAAPQTATLASTGALAVEVSGIAAAADPFARVGGDCPAVPFTLASGESCTLIYDFTPTTPGSVNQSVAITSNAEPLVLDLTGFGVGEAQPVLSIVPAQIDFGSIEVGATGGPQTATLENTGLGDANTLSFTLPGNAFIADTSDCGAVLDAGASCDVAVTFTPLASGPVSAVLRIDSAEGVSTTLDVAGNGVAPPVPDLAFVPEHVDFGEVPVGSTSAPQTATLQNTGNGDAIGLIFTTPNGGFDADVSACGDTLIAGESCQIDVAFTPGTPGASSATLEVETTDGASATLGNVSQTSQAPDQWLYYFSSAMRGIFRIDPGDINSSRPLFTSIDDGEAGFVSVAGLAVDSHNCSYYWSAASEIRRAHIDGTGEEIMFSVPEGLVDIALDLASGKLYFTQFSSIYRGDVGLTGLESVEHLAITPDDTDRVSRLTLDTSGNRMYWNGVSGIWSADLDGSSVQLTIDTSSNGGSAPAGLALDLSGGKIYWSDIALEGDLQIHRANLDGTQQELVLALSDPDGSNAADIVIDSTIGKMFWSGGGTEGHFYRSNLDGSGLERMPTGYGTDIAGLTFAPGGIDALCGLPQADICPAGADCDRVEAVYWTGGSSSGGELWRAGADGTDRQMLHEWVGGQPLDSAVSRDLGKVYWTKTPNEVYRANLDGTDVELVLQLPFATVGDFPYGISLDGAAGKLYVTQNRRNGFNPPNPDRQHATMWRADLDGGDLEVRFLTLDSPDMSFNLDEEARVGYIGIGDTLSRFDLDDAGAPELVASGLPPQHLWPPFAEERIGNVGCRLPDPGSDEANKCYWQQSFSCGPNCTTGGTYRMDLDGSNVERLPWTDNRSIRAIDGYGKRMYGTNVLALDHMSRWEIGDGEDFSLVHASERGIGNIALLPAASGGTWATLSLTGVGVAPELVAAPASIDFGAVPVGEAGGPETVTLTNAGGAPVQVTSIATAAPPFARIGGDCPATPFELAPAASCTLDYRFAPTSLGDFDQLFAILNSGDPVTFVLAGEGVTPPPRIDVDPDSLAATLASGQTGNQTLTIGNLGEETLEWAVTEDGGVAGTMLAPVRRLAGASAPSASATDLVSVRGSPLPGLGPRAPEGGIVDCDTVTGLVVHDDGTVENGYTGNPDVVASVMFADRFTPGGYPANLTAACVAFLTMGPTSLDFEIVVVDDDGAGGSPGTELGALPVSASGIPGAVGQPVWFSYDLASLDLSIDSGSVYIGVRWIPANPSVFIASDESVGNPVGFAGGYWWNDNVDVWATTETAFPEYRSLFARAVVEVIDCTLPAWLAVDPTSGSVAGGGSQTVDVAFDAGSLAPGAYDANLCIGSNDPVNPLTVVPVQLTVSPLAAELSFDPIALDFGNVAVGTTGTLEATLANTGNADADIDFTVGPPGNGFDADTSACGDNLAVGASCPVSVTFTPTAAGPAAAILTVSSDAGASAQLDLAGDGILLTDADVGIAISAMSDYLRPGQIADYLVTLDNAGPAAATGAEVASQLSPDLDIDFASWLCVGPANTGCTPEGVGDLADSGLNLPAGGSVSYLLSAPVRWEAQGPVETSATASYADDPNPANDSAVAVAPLVVYRDGFEPYGGIAATPLLPLEESFGATDTLTLGWPVAASGAQVETVLAAAPVLVGASAAKPAFRLERFHVGPLGWTRLVALDEQGAEYASRWMPVTYGAQATLALADVLQMDDATGESRPQRTVLLFIAAGELQLPLAGVPEAYRLWSIVPASITPLGNSN